MADSKEKKQKKSRKERERELRNDGLIKGGGVNFDNISDRQIGDKRFERERALNLMVQEQGVAGLKTSQKQATTSTFDAFTRMAAGLEGRTLAQKIADPNRPTWEQYKKDNEDKLDNVGGEVRKMVEYRRELDKERDSKLNAANSSNAGKKTNNAISDDDDSDEDESEVGSDKKKKSKKEKKKHKKKDKKQKVGSTCFILTLSHYRFAEE